METKVNKKRNLLYFLILFKSSVPPALKVKYKDWLNNAYKVFRSIPLPVQEGFILNNFQISVQQNLQMLTIKIKFFIFIVLKLKKKLQFLYVIVLRIPCSSISFSRSLLPDTYIEKRGLSCLL